MAKTYYIYKGELEKNKGMIVLGSTHIDIDYEKEVSLVAGTMKGWVSKKDIILEPAIIIGADPEDEDMLILETEQAERLINKYDRKKYKEWSKDGLPQIEGPKRNDTNNWGLAWE